MFREQQSGYEGQFSDLGNVSRSEGQLISRESSLNHNQKSRDKKQKPQVQSNVQKVGFKQGKSNISQQRGQKNIKNLIYCKCLFPNTITNSFENNLLKGANNSFLRKQKNPIIQVTCNFCNCPKQSSNNAKVIQKEEWTELEQQIKQITGPLNNHTEQKQPFQNAQKSQKKNKIIKKSQQPKREAKYYKNQLKKQGYKKVNRKERVQKEDNQRQSCESDNNKASQFRKLRKFLEQLSKNPKMTQTINKHYNTMRQYRNVTEEELRAELTFLCQHMVSIEHGKGAMIDTRSVFQHIDYQFLHGVIKAVLDDTRIDCPKERKALLESIAEKFYQAEISQQPIEEVFMKTNFARYIIRQQAYLQFYGKIKYVSQIEKNIRSFIRDFTETLVKFKNGEALQKRLIKKNIKVATQMNEDNLNDGKVQLVDNDKCQSRLANNDYSIVSSQVQSRPLIQLRPYYQVQYDPFFYGPAEQDIPLQIPMQNEQELSQNSSNDISFQISMQIFQNPSLSDFTGFR